MSLLQRLSKADALGSAVAKRGASAAGKAAGKTMGGLKQAQRDVPTKKTVRWVQTRKADLPISRRGLFVPNPRMADYGISSEGDSGVRVRTIGGKTITMGIRATNGTGLKALKEISVPRMKRRIL